MTTRARLAACEEDVLAAKMVRAIVYKAEYDIPFRVLFDQDDARASHVLAETSGEPVASLRILWWHDRAKVERWAALPGSRSIAVLRPLLLLTRQLIADRGIRTVMAYVREDDAPVWRRQLGNARPHGEPYQWGGRTIMPLIGDLPTM